MADDTNTETATEDSPYSVTIEDAGPACKALTITIPADRIKEKIEESYATLDNDAVLPGFRKGRAPRRLLEKRFAGSIKDDTKNALLSESYSSAIEGQDLDVLGEPEIDNVEDLDIPESGDLTYTVKVEVTPDVELPAYDTIKVNKKAISVSDDEVAAEINRIREQAGKPSTPEGAKAEVGDYVMVDTLILAGNDAGDDAETLAAFPGAHILINGEDKDFKGHVAGIVVEDLGKQMLGKTTGDQVSISMDGPSSHEDEKIKDQPITLRMNVQTIHRIELASVETIIEHMGLSNAEELDERIRAMMTQRAEQNQNADLYQQVCDQLVDGVELELPAGITSRQTERVLRRQMMDMMYRGTPESEIEGKVAETRGESEEAAVRQLKQFFILDKASKDLDIDVDEQELNSRIATMAIQKGRRPEKVRQEMQQQGQIEQLYLQIREQKTLDKILESAEVTEVAAEDDKPEKTAKKKTSEKKSTKKSTKKKAAAKKDDSDAS